MAAGGNEMQIAISVEAFQAFGHHENRTGEGPPLSVTREHRQSPTSRKVREKWGTLGFEAER
jgi:hypothetical protein